MRVWRLERNADINAYEISDDTRTWCLALKDGEMAQFIVDALNEKEAYDNLCRCDCDPCMRCAKHMSMAAT